MRNAYSILDGRAEGKRPLGTPRRGWEGNIRTGLRKIGWKVANGMHLSQDRDKWRAGVNTVMNLLVP
jgi:hypothetical protein